MRCLSLFALLALMLSGCASKAPPAQTPTAPPPSLTSAPATPVAEPLLPPSHSLHRAAVHQVVAAGLGAFLQRLAVDEKPVFLQGKFHGFRVASLAGDPAFWHDVDLKPGDVVTRVNGFSIERPEGALEAFRSLEVASELRVEYERDGAPRELRYAIVDP